jgi:hypothetical protein
VAGFAGGSALLLAGLLIVAGVLKLVRPRPFAHAVYRLLPRHLVRRSSLARVAPWLAGTVEVLAGAGLLAVRSVWVAGVVAALYLGFVGVVVVAIRKGTSCGCFSSFSDGAAGGAELGRSLALGVLAVVLVAVGSWSWRPDAIAWLAVLVVVVAAAAALGGRTRPSGWLLLGRVDSRLAGVDLPAGPLRDSRERASVIDAARRSPSVLAFESWLGDRVSDVDWRRCEVRPGGATPPGGPRVPCMLVVPRCRAGLSLTVSVPWTGSDAQNAVVIAVLDGRPVSAVAGKVAAVSR